MALPLGLRLSHKLRALATQSDFFPQGYDYKFFS